MAGTTSPLNLCGLALDRCCHADRICNEGENVMPRVECLGLGKPLDPTTTTHNHGTSSSAHSLIYLSGLIISIYN